MVKNKIGFLKAIFIIQITIIGAGIPLFYASVLGAPLPSDHMRDMVLRKDRHGYMFGYVFFNWESFMQSGVEDEYIDLISWALDFVFVHAQWSVVGLSNDTLNTDYLGNLSLFIQKLYAKGVRTVIHVWVSSYSPKWMYNYTPELIGQPDRWMGIDPNTDNLTLLAHRNALKYSMIHYQEMLCQYLIDNNLTDAVMGFCLDDETQSEYWADFFAALTDTIHGYNPSWITMAMFNRYDKYHLTGDTGMDVNAMDPYVQDPELVERILYAYKYSGTNRLFVLLDAMGPHQYIPDLDKMRRQAWISWFMGADAIGWYTFLYPNSEWACAVSRWQEGKGPGITLKTRVTLETYLDIKMLNNAADMLRAAANNPAEADRIWNTMLAAYSAAKRNDFTSANAILENLLGLNPGED